MFVALGFALFGLAARYLPIFPEEKAHTPTLPKLEIVRAEYAEPVHAGD
jgi:hypothetical protein